MARRPKPSGRRTRKEILSSYGRHLVYSEGSKTEPYYIDNIKRVIEANYKYHNSDVLIEIVPHGGYNTLGLVRYAEEDIEKRLNRKEKIDHVWIFYDRDSFSKDDYDNAHHTLINKNKENKLNHEDDPSDDNYIRWHSMWSNECFEIWVLLHFNYSDSSLGRDTYIDRIENHLGKGNYTKNMDSLYDVLKDQGDIEQAINFAKRLEESNGINNPSTGVYQFIEYFRRYLKL